jgi:hypothetical protein
MSERHENNAAKDRNSDERTWKIYSAESVFIETHAHILVEIDIYPTFRAS